MNTRKDFFAWTIFLISALSTISSTAAIWNQKCLTYPILKKQVYNQTIMIQPGADAVLPVEGGEIELSLAGTDLKDIASVSLYKSKLGNKWIKGNLICRLNTPEETLIRLKGSWKLESPDQVLWVSVELSSDANIDHKVMIHCTKIFSVSGEVVPADLNPNMPFRLGVAVRQSGQDGVNTSRIPGLVTALDGSLIMCYDARKSDSRDLQGDIDICIQRSKDGGRNWLPQQTVLDMGAFADLPEKFNGVSDANILVDKKTGDVFVAACWMYGVKDETTGIWTEGLTNESNAHAHQWTGKSTGTGWGIKETSQFLLTQSTDNGITWSQPRNLTRALKDSLWWLYAPAPGSGFCLEDGTLIMPSQGRAPSASGEVVPVSGLTYSKDHGKTWKRGIGIPYEGTNECQAVQLSDGSIMLNMRYGNNKGNLEQNGRIVSITKDLGKTWVEHSTSHKTLVEPTCMASLYKHHYRENGKWKSVLLFLNPNDKEKRKNLTLKVSFDDGKTWPEAYWILLDEGVGRGYSSITSINETTIGILFEGSWTHHMSFMRIPIEEILKLPAGKFIKSKQL